MHLTHYKIETFWDLFSKTDFVKLILVLPMAESLARRQVFQHFKRQTWTRWFLSLNCWTFKPSQSFHRHCRALYTSFLKTFPAAPWLNQCSTHRGKEGVNFFSAKCEEGNPRPKSSPNWLPTQCCMHRTWLHCIQHYSCNFDLISARICKPFSRMTTLLYL